MVNMPAKQKITREEAVTKYKSAIHKLNIISFAALILGVIAIFTALATLYMLAPTALNHNNNSNSILTTSTPAAPGAALTNINTPLNSTSLAVINQAPNAYFETAGEMYLNATLSDPIFVKSNNVTGFDAGNNKSSVLYLGSITCIWCGENRWAMALALSRFGNFSQLFIGYSSLGDGDVPTLYWNINDVNKSSDQIGNFYSSKYINFLSIEDTNPITAGFNLNSPAQMLVNVNAAGNHTYISAFNYILNLSKFNATAFSGTPYTIWGNRQFQGADAEVFGNSTPTSQTLPLTYMTHGQVFAQLGKPTDQFAWGEYAGADVYIASVCKSINNTAAICSLPAIRSIEALEK